MKKILLTLVVTISSYIISNAQTTPNLAEIAFDSTIINYGKVEHNANGIREFTFKNTGTAPLIIKSCQASCGCTVPTWPQAPILPGATSSIQVKYATDHVGSFEKTITVSSNAKTPMKILKVKGVVNPDPAGASPSGGGN